MKKALLVALASILAFQVYAADPAAKKAKTYYVASECGIVLDSDVYNGGGTDQTAKIQAILDKAPALGRLHFVMDGAALISNSLRVHSNTTIECPDKSCGFFLADGSDVCLVTNANGDAVEIKDRNISLIGGTYNHNSPGQVHDRPADDPRRNPMKEVNNSGMPIYETCVFAMEFYGVENFVMRDLTIANQRTYALNLLNWKYVTIENIHVDRRIRPDAQNQDGLHILGPGRFLTMKNIYGNSGDDFIAITPDEVDLKSSISDVLIDGVQLEEADQAIRLLCRGEGRLDRVVIKNVSGTYRSYGFIVNPWFPGVGGHYGNIVFDTIDLRPMKNNYDYAEPFLFKLGGNIECLTLRNIYHHNPEQMHLLVEVGRFYMGDIEAREMPTNIDCLIMDGIFINEKENFRDTYVDVSEAHIGTLFLNDVMVNRPAGTEPYGSFVTTRNGAKIDRILTDNVVIDCMKSLTNE